MPVSLLLALMSVAAPNTTGPPMSAWSACMIEYVNLRLSKLSTEAIVNGSFVACAAQESAARQAYINDFGPEAGASAFVGIKRGVRDIMLRRVAQAKELRGYR